MSPNLGRWVRWGWLATTLAMGVALLATAWFGRQRAAAAAATLNRGQGEVLLEAARQTLRGASLPFDGALLDSLLLRQRSAGLRFVALLELPGGVLAQAGTAAGALPAPQPGPREPPPSMTTVGGRVRMMGITRLGQGPPNQGPQSQAQRGGGAPSGGQQGRAQPEARLPEPPRERVRPPLLVIEFEPVVAEGLAAEATRTFVLSALVAAALLAASFLLWRLSLRQQLMERRLEQQRRLGVLGEMSAVLAHEIRNPLASLKGHAQLLAEHLGAGSPDGRKAELVVREAVRLEALTGDLLDFARTGPIDVRPADPTALLRSCAAEVAPDGFVVRAEAAPPTWPLDEKRLRQALVNVLRNAHQVSPEGTRPEATVARENDLLVFTVRDFGPGVAAGEEKRIFSPFYTTRTTGTGLGLAVALRVAEMHEGTIVAANHSDGGAVFRLAIPRS